MDFDTFVKLNISHWPREFADISFDLSKLRLLNKVATDYGGRFCWEKGRIVGERDSWDGRFITPYKATAMSKMIYEEIVPNMVSRDYSIIAQLYRNEDSCGDAIMARWDYIEGMVLWAKWAVSYYRSGECEGHSYHWSKARRYKDGNYPDWILDQMIAGESIDEYNQRKWDEFLRDEVIYLEGFLEAYE